MAHPLVKVRVSRSDIANIALEVLNVHGIEADDRGEKADIGFRHVRA